MRRGGGSLQHRLPNTLRWRQTAARSAARAPASPPSLLPRTHLTLPSPPRRSPSLNSKARRRKSPRLRGRGRPSPPASLWGAGGTKTNHLKEKSQPQPIAQSDCFQCKNVVFSDMIPWLVKPTCARAARSAAVHAAQQTARRVGTVLARPPRAARARGAWRSGVRGRGACDSAGSSGIGEAQRARRAARESGTHRQPCVLDEGVLVCGHVLPFVVAPRTQPGRTR